jgi:dinuclear metal center YbgI/SA1388 family protein
MKIYELLESLQEWAPFNYQESYDNSGLLVGNMNNPINKILISLDITEEVMQEAIAQNYDLIISHHPIIFRGLKSLTGSTPEERVIMEAIKHNIAIIAMHTNLDNAFRGVNYKISQLLGLKNIEILQPQKNILKKLAVFVPHAHLNNLRTALFDAGAGNIGNYDQCSFGSQGIGSFRGNKQANPFVGTVGELHEEAETKLELVFPKHLQNKIIESLIQHHPYEEVAYDIYPLDNSYPKVGAGAIGELNEAMDEVDFLKFLKEKLHTNCVRHTPLRGKKIEKIALCGGSGSFLIGAAKAAKADVFVSGDIKYHEFFEADKNFIIADVGHYESEQFTKELIHDFLIEKFPNFAAQISEHQTNPINYF